MKIMAMILAGGRGSRLSVLSEKRAKPAVPFAGKYRIIDFTLSNCVNSGITDVAILTQYRPYSLNEHVRRGRPWDLDRTSGGLSLLHPYLGRGNFDWYLGTADAVRQNLNFIRRRNPDLVLILAGDHVYKMDYGQLAEFHLERRADVTIPVIEMPLEAMPRLGEVRVDDGHRVVGFVEKPPQPEGTLASMGIYMFNPSVLEERLEDPYSQSDHDFGKHIVPSMIRSHRVYAYPFGEQYWVDVGTVEAYWQAHMDLLADEPRMDLGDLNWLIHTSSEERPPARLWEGSRIERSLVSHGCDIRGTVERSVLSPGVRVARGARVRDSIILTDSVIEEGAVLDRVILDKRVHVGKGARLVSGEESAPNATGLEGMTSGVSLVGRNSVLPDGLVVGRNCIIAAELAAGDFPASTVPSGQNVGL